MTLQPHPDHPDLRVVDHPLVQHKLSHMRERGQTMDNFRRLLREITLLIAYEATRDMPLRTTAIETPVATMQAPVLEGPLPVIVPILRAGLGMADAMIELMPNALMGHVGVYRDEATKRPIGYLVRLPDLAGRPIYVVDPMLATGNSAVHALEVLTRAGADPARLRMLVLLAAPDGVRRIHAAFPGLSVYAAALDSHLNDAGFIVPGLGDAGDRFFGTV